MSQGPRRVVFIAFEGVNLLDLCGPLNALFYSGPTRPGQPRSNHYEIVVASMAGGMVGSNTGMAIDTQPLSSLDAVDIDTIIVPGGSTAGRPTAPPELAAWLSARAGRVRRICSVCSGAFLLAAAGLLDGRRATTHWFWASLLQADNPTVSVQADALFVSDGPIWTSGGMTAGIDMALALIEEDYGHSSAIHTARSLVMFMKRPGGQTQFSTALDYQSRSDPSFSELHAWIRQNLSDDLRMSRLADKVGMTERTFTRAYRDKLGQSPAKAIETIRVEAACDLLASTQLPVKSVAGAVGFGAEQNMRRVFMRRMGVNPGDYRRRFSPSSQAVQTNLAQIGDGLHLRSATTTRLSVTS